jgi:hypothetical protein
MSTTTENQHERIHEVHEHLQFDSTYEQPQEVRERLRREELAAKRKMDIPETDALDEAAEDSRL